MSMSTYVVGFRPPDKKWKEMKEVYDACVKAKIGIPEDVNKFFGFNHPDPKGIEVEIPHKEYNCEMGGGVEIEVSKIPKDIAFIRFYNQW